VLAAAILAAAADRVLGAHIYDRPAARHFAVAAPVLVLRSPRGVHHRAAVLRHRFEIFPVFSRKPIFGYKTLVYATIIAALSVRVTTTRVTARCCSPFFACMTCSSPCRRA
jgi:cytochrome c oxidase subunit 1